MPLTTIKGASNEVDELVCFQDAQILPLFLLRLKSGAKFIPKTVKPAFNLVPQRVAVEALTPSGEVAVLRAEVKTLKDVAKEQEKEIKELKKEVEKQSREQEKREREQEKEINGMKKEQEKQARELEELKKIVAYLKR